MDTLDKKNVDPFALNANPDIMLQKEGLLLDLGKQNGAAATNGKRPRDEEFDCNDMGPETDVDAVDDVLKSPTRSNHFDREEEEEKATLETEHIKNDSVKLTREEAATPPVDSVHDTSGLVDNVAESCEDSDDEWNYFKGDTTDKENVPPSETDKEVCDIIDNDAMSHLNPNAAEFVPLSPTRGSESPAFLALKDEPLIAQSPKRGTAYNIDKVPNLTEFECEIKSRPSDVIDTNDDGEAKLSSEEIMLNFLNGKNMEEIEFRPVSTPIKAFKADEFHFGPNATPFSTPGKFDISEALSTQAVRGDESTSYLEKAFDSSYACSEISKSLSSKNDDPMSTSFYLDKDNVDDINPFDLNKVHMLPENIDEYFEKASETPFNDTISDLPEHDPGNYEKAPEETLPERLYSPEKNELLGDIPEAAKSPFDQVEELLDFASNRETGTPVSVHSPTPELPIPQVSPLILETSPVMAPSLVSSFPNVPQSPITVHSPIPVCAQSPCPTDSPLRSPISHSPIPAQSPLPTHSLEHQVPDIFAECRRETIVIPKPELEIFIPTPIEGITLSQLPVLEESPVLHKSPPLLDNQDIPSPHSPVPSQENESPVEDVTSSAKDSPLLASSPLGNRLDDLIVNLAVVQETKFVDTSLPLLDDALLSPQSKVETESVITDVNSFLERSLLPDVASPLSPNEQEDTIIFAPFKSGPDVLSLQDVLVKSDVIAPEFPVQQQIIETPTEITADKKPIVAKVKANVSSTTGSAATKNPTPKAATATTKSAPKPLSKSAPATKPATPKTPQAKTPVSSPKPASKPIARTSLTNGVAKVPASSTTHKTTVTTATTKPVPSKTAPRPATAPAKAPVKQAPVPATSRPVTLTSKSITSTTTAVKKTTVTSTATNAKGTLKSATSSKDPKPRVAAPPTIPPPISRPKTAPAKPTTKTQDTEKSEKSIKEAVNKQTAARTVTTATTTAGTKPLRKVLEPKAPATSRTVVNKPATSIGRGSSDAKKPQELVRHAATKTKVTRTTTKVQENGVGNNINVTSTKTIEEPHLIKDVSPIVENSQLLD